MRQRAVPVAVLVATLGWLAYLWWGHWGDANAGVWIASSLAVTAAIAGVVVSPASPRAHAAIAGSLMIGLAVFVGMRAFGGWPFAWDSMPDARYAAVIATLAIGIAVGLFAGAFWARWGAIAFAACAGLGGALNSYNMRLYRDETAWLAAMGVIGAAILLSQLMRSTVTAYFAQRTHAMWSSRDRVVGIVRWAAIANLGAVPMLLLYGLRESVTPSTAWSAFALIPVLASGALLVIARRTIGLVMLSAGGLALLAHTAMTVRGAAHPFAFRVASYYAAFWIPAALLGLAAGATVFARSRRR